ncbi:MAG TPA: DUF1629 domain-containing protein [Phycisphaerae bacterium]|nr:DUF1629 domain-containing protein [Phycisphaerae bacterium]
MPIQDTGTLTIYALGRDEAFASLYVDGRDDFTVEVKQLFDGTPIADLPHLTLWRYAGDPYLPAGDLVNCGPAVLMSRRTVEVLGDILTAHGQLFPVASSEGEFFAYNVTTVVNALDWEHSDLEMDQQLRREREAGVPREIHHVKRYWFHADRVAGIDIFKLPEFPRYEVYVSDRFVRRVKRAGLHGFWFERLWSPGDRLPDLRPRRLPG